ncbi:MAG: adenosine deaminase [Erysipelotrichaceae bacterium]|nr:adenosine deaminase [Erysipelotrichaceae bacterium]
MIDLHLHLDGSLSKEDFIVLSRKEKIGLGKDFPNNIYVSNDCPSLEVYLERFDLPLKLLQKPENLTFATRSLVLRLAQMGFIYAEIRFAPLLHTREGMSQLKAVQAAIQGLKEGLHMTKGFSANLILCCMRHASEKENLETIEVAKKLRRHHVVAVDLAGAEALHPGTYYKKIYDLARKYRLNITIHSGEATGSEEIIMALDNGAMRIGHGVHLSLDDESIARVKERSVCFEFCPTSNLQTKSLKSYSDVPLRKFLEKGIPVTINSDNMTVSDTDAIRDMKEMVKAFKLTKEEVHHLIETSIKHSFAGFFTKKKLLSRLNSKFDTYYQSVK